MRFFCASIALIVFGAAVVLGHTVHHGHEHGHHQSHKATSYAQVTKHEDQEDHHDGGHHGGHYEEHNHGHQEQHGHDNHDEGHHDGGDVKYEFAYGVKDSKTGDIKDHWESRDGHSVKGTYSLKEADGTTRVVEYTSDKKKGFEATVHKIGEAHHDEGHQGHSSGHHHGLH